MPGVQLLDVSGPLDVFAEANVQARKDAYRPIRTAGGAALGCGQSCGRSQHRQPGETRGFEPASLCSHPYTVDAKISTAIAPSVSANWALARSRYCFRGSRLSSKV